jgi:outer membrane receptor protein involved in Fe transport
MKKSVLSILMVLCCFTAYAQTGTIRGQIVEDATGETLIGATVMVEGTTTGATTDLDGNYTINVAPGTYKLKASFISFNPQVINGVEVKEGEVTVLPVIRLADATTELQEVVVQAEVLRDSDVGLLTVQKKSANMLDAISAQTFSRTGDSNVGSAMKRVTGVSVEGGKFVYVRGLGDRYSKTNLNGADIPGLDPNRNSVQLDLFPANLINNIVVYKTFTPNLSGNFTGGYVDVETKDFPEDFTFQLSTSLGYNTQSTFNNNFLTYKGGKLDFLGFDDGSRRFPDLIDVENREAIPARSYANPTIANKLNEVTRAFNKEWVPTQQAAPLDHSFSVSLGNQKELFGKPVGFLGSLSYSRSFDFYDGGKIGRYTLTGEVDQVNSLVEEISLNDARGVENVLWGAMFGTSVKLNGYNKIGFTALRNQSGTKEARYLDGIKTTGDGKMDYFTNTLLFEERALTSFQLKGEHALAGGEGLRIKWISSYTLSSMEQPDLRFFTFGDYGVNSRGLRIEPSIGQPPTRYTRNMDQYNFDNKLDVTLPFKQWNEEEAKLQFGGAYVIKDRTFREFQYRFDTDRTQFNGDPVAHVADENLFSLENSSGVYVYDAYDPRNNYEAEESVGAAYAMVDMPLANKLRAVAGVRAEKTDIFFTSYAAEDPKLKSQFGELKDKKLLDNFDVLPSVNFTYELGEEMNLRAAYGRTLARPNFRELAPYQSFDFVGGYNYVGNDTLGRTLVDNIDLRWEMFPRPSEILSLSVFYKSFTDPIEATFVPLSLNPLITWKNVEQANVYGLEVEARKSLEFISEKLLNFNVGANLTLVKSEVSIGREELERKRRFNPGLAETRQMAGQSPYIVNTYLGYKSELYEANMAFNVQGERLSIVSQDATPDVYEQPVPSLNFNVSRKFAERWKVKVSAENILNPMVKFTQEYKDQEYIFQQYKKGRDVSVGVSYTLY